MTTMNVEMPEEVLPKFYFYRRGKGWVESDRDFILARMSVIPADKKKEVIQEYERLFRGKEPENRRQANEYLHQTAVKYRRAMNGS